MSNCCVNFLFLLCELRIQPILIPQVLLQFEPTNVHSFIKIKIILHCTSLYMFWALLAHQQGHTIPQNSHLTFSACSRASKNPSLCYVYVADQVVH